MQERWSTDVSDISHPGLLGAFMLDDFRHLRLPRSLKLVSTYQFLTRQVQRWPKQLSFHFCRINCAIRIKDEEIVYASILDLFYVLEEKGQPLRERIFARVTAYLPKDMLLHLESALNGKISYRELPFTKSSVFHDGMQASDETDKLFFEKNDDQVSIVDPVSTARQCLEAGQLEQAQEILESQLEIDPDRLEIRQNLLEIYCATKDKVSFMASFQLLKTKGFLDESWEDAVSLFDILN